MHGAQDAGCPHPCISLNKPYVLVHICGISIGEGHDISSLFKNAVLVDP